MPWRYTPRRRGPCGRSWPSGTRASRNRGASAARRRGPSAGIRVVDVGTRISAPPFLCRVARQNGADVIKVEAPRARVVSCAAWGRSRTGRRRARLLPSRGPSRAGAGAGSPVTCGSRKGGTSSSASWRPPMSCARTSAPAPWNAGASAPRTCPTTSSTCGSVCSGRPGPTLPVPVSTVWASRSAVSCTSPVTPTARRCAPA